MNKLKVVLFVCVIFFVSNKSVLATMDEAETISKKYRNAIHYYTKRFGEKVSPIFVKAIVFVESRGKPEAINKKTRAKGLMQITPIALEQVREAYPHERFSNNLFNPDNNIKVGIAYLAYMLEEYEIENNDALAVGFSSGPTKGERYSQNPRKNAYVHKVKKMTKLFHEL